MNEKHLLIVNDNGTVTVFHADPAEVKPLYAEGDHVVYLGAEAKIIECKIGPIPEGLYAPFYTLVKINSEFAGSVVKVIEGNLLEENPRLHDNIIDLIPGPKRPRPSQRFADAKDKLDKRMADKRIGWPNSAWRMESEQWLATWDKFINGLDMSAIEGGPDED